MSSLCPIIEHFIICLAISLFVCVFVWSFLSSEGQRKTALPNQVLINGTRPTLKITYSRKVIHFEICLPHKLYHFLSPLQSTRDSTAINTMFIVLFNNLTLREASTRKLIEGEWQPVQSNMWMRTILSFDVYLLAINNVLMYRYLTRCHSSSPCSLGSLKHKHLVKEPHLGHQFIQTLCRNHDHW